MNDSPQPPDDFPESVELPIDGALDLHTFPPKVVKELVPEYLRACREKGIYSVRIIHGKGIGALRTTVHSLLEKDPIVAHFHLASEQSGGWGATIAHLKATSVRASDFHYDLPGELIAQHPAADRHGSRLLHLDRSNNSFAHRRFLDLPDLLQPGDLLIANDSKVIPARLRGRKPDTGGEIEILLLEENAPEDWWVMLKPAKRVRPGTSIIFENKQTSEATLLATVVDKNAEGHCRLNFQGPRPLLDSLNALGETPLPPYISRHGAPSPDDHDRYQTIFANHPGSVAAPTAGLHFTPEIMTRLEAKGVQLRKITLHVGLGTFAPVKTENLEEHPMHEERFEISADTAEALNSARRDGRRIIAVGTTTVRALESVGASEAEFQPARGRTRIFIYPPYNFRTIDGLITNFHLPNSTLLMLVSAFASPGQTTGKETILAAYQSAIELRYRFFSYGDAMLIL